MLPTTYLQEQTGTQSSLYSVWGKAGFQCNFRPFVLAHRLRHGRSRHLASQFHRPPRLGLILSSNPVSHFGLLSGKSHAAVLLFCLTTYETTKQRAARKFSRLFAKETSETRKLNDRLRERKASQLQAKVAGDVNPDIPATRKDAT
jgi:hypothetical protein